MEGEETVMEGGESSTEVNDGRGPVAASPAAVMRPRGNNAAEDDKAAATLNYVTVREQDEGEQIVKEVMEDILSVAVKHGTKDKVGPMVLYIRW